MTARRFQIRAGHTTEHGTVTWDEHAEPLSPTIRTLASAGEAGALMLRASITDWRWIDNRTLIGRKGRRLVRAEQITGEP